jgi:hypothetical protein
LTKLFQSKQTNTHLADAIRVGVATTQEQLTTLRAASLADNMMNCIVNGNETGAEISNS